MTAFDELPTEILRSVVDCLRPPDDSATLISLMRVSRTMWEIAGRQLYANLTLDKDQVVRLIAGADWQPPKDSSSPRVPLSLSKRTRTALSFVRRLTLLGLWHQPILDLLCDATVAGKPLFPHVEQVLLDIGPPFQRWSRSRRPSPRDPGIFIFGAIDACVFGDGNEVVLFQLPAQRYRSITLHEVGTGILVQRIVGNGEYIRCEQWRSFQTGTQDALEMAAAYIETEAGKDLPAPWRPNLPPSPVQLYLKEGVTLGKKMVEWFDAEQSDRIRVFADTTNILQIHHFPRSGEGCLPCALCGTSYAGSHDLHADWRTGKTWRAKELQKLQIWISPANRAFWRMNVGRWTPSGTSSEESLSSYEDSSEDSDDDSSGEVSTTEDEASESADPDDARDDLSASSSGGSSEESSAASAQYVAPERPAVEQTQNDC